MASIEEKVRCPSVPEHLEAEVAGRARVMRLPLAAFTDDELQEVAMQWGDALLRAAKDQRENGLAPKPRKPRTPKAE